MPKPGPKPKPSAQKKLEGTYRPDRAAPNEPTPARGARTPTAPSWLPEDAARFWRSSARARWEIGTLTPIDVEAYARLCYYRALHCRAVEALERAGGELTQTTQTGYTQLTGLASAVMKLEASIVRLEREFGETPSARTRINAAPVEEKPADPYEAFLGSETAKRKRASG